MVGQNKLTRGDGARNYGIDLLRILSMFMIVILHVNTHGGVLDATHGDIIKNQTAWFIEAFAFASVNCFSLISGYVGVDSRYRYRNIALLWLRVFYYNALITLLFFIFNRGSVGNEQLVSLLFPVSAKEYWYFTSYFVMFLFLPLLNKAVECLSKRAAAAVILVFLVFVGVLSPVFTRFFGDPFVLSDGYSPWWLAAMYFIGGYIKKYGLFPNIRRGIWLLIFVLSCLCAWAMQIAVRETGKAVLHEDTGVGIIMNNTFILIVLQAVALLMIFRDVKISRRFSAFIGFLTPMVFSVYLIHDHPLIREYVMSRLIPVDSGDNCFMIALAVIGGSLIIFTACLLIDIPRRYLFEALKLRKHLDKAERGIRAKLGPKIEKTK